MTATPSSVRGADAGVRASAASYDAVVIGGGFYGSVLALHLRRSGAQRVVLVEAGADLMQRASYANQARVHHGYHYPRSVLTAVRSRANFPRFAKEFRDCIDDSFLKYYAIARVGSNVTAGQFRRFCERIGAPLEPAPAAARRLFAADLVEDVFVAQEYAFDAVKLRRRLAGELVAAGVDVRLETEATHVGATGRGVEVHCASAEGRETVTARRVYNCTYSRANRLLVASGLPPVPLKHELTELALVRMPDELAGVGITVMCGPYFSTLPFPARGLHSLSHVRYTPHHAWHDDGVGEYRDPYEVLAQSPRVSHVPRMLRDAQRYVPALAECRYDSSLWEVKTTLPRSEGDDSRPILFRECEGLAALATIVGAKVDNVYDVLEFPSLVRALAGAGG